MGWSVGYDERWKRDVGYGVPATCDHPDCNEKIDRGLGYVCGGEPFGGDSGCGLFFCYKHLRYKRVEDCREYVQTCYRCFNDQTPYKPKPDHMDWLLYKLTDASWKEWRDKYPKLVAKIKKTKGMIDSLVERVERLKRGEDV